MRVLFLGCLIALQGCAAMSVPLQPFAEDTAWVLKDNKQTYPILDSMERQIDAQQPHQLYSLLAWHNGALIFEKYANAYTQDTPHEIRSATKSITALLVGIALEKKYFKDLDAPVRYQNKTYPFSLKHLLTMSSGKSCNDRTLWSPGNEEWMYLSENWSDYFFNLKQGHEPGSVTHYCTGGVVALGALISEASHMPLQDFAKKYLFEPLGIQNYSWATYANETQVDTGGHLKITARGLAKIGQLVLQQGQWNGEQLVPESWVQSIATFQTHVDNNRYSYLWWLKEVKNPKTQYVTQILMARGNGGQNLYIVPKEKLVVVSLTGYYNSDKAAISDQLFYQGVLPAVQSNEPEVQ